MIIWYNKSSNRLTATVVTHADKVAVNDATVEVVMFDRAGNELAGETWPLSFAASGADGIYTRVPSADLVIETNSKGRATCFAAVTVTRGVIKRYKLAKVKVITDS